jgi:hypothetical protein
MLWRNSAIASSWPIISLVNRVLQADIVYVHRVVAGAAQAV